MSILAQETSSSSSAHDRGNLDILEKGKETVPEEPQPGQKVDKSNCCVPIKRTHQKETLTDNNLAEFKNGFLQHYNALNDLLYDEIIPKNKDASVVPFQANSVSTAFSLPDAKPQASAVAKIDNLSNNPHTTESAIEIDQTAAVDLFRTMASDIMNVRNLIEYGLLNIKVSGDANIEAYRLMRFKQKQLFDSADEYFAGDFTKYRYGYRVFSKLPMTQKSMYDLKLQMLDKFQAAIENAEYFTDLTTELSAVKTAVNKVRLETLASGTAELINAIDTFMIKMADWIAANPSNQEAREHYEIVANNWFRTNENNKSVTCYAFYMNRRRQSNDNDFAKAAIFSPNFQVIDTVKQIGQNTELTSNAVDALAKVAKINTAVNKEDAFDQTPQRKATTAYILQNFKVLNDLLAEQHDNQEGSAYKDINTGSYYQQTIRDMEDWRWALLNLAFKE